MKDEPAHALHKGIGLLGMVALGMGSAVGVSIFSVLAPTTALAGPGMLIAMLLAMAPMILFALVYAFLGSTAPVSGASYAWPRRFIHPFVAFFISWLRIAGSTAAIVVLAVVLVSYWSMAAPLPAKPTMFAIFALVYVSNILGVSLAAKGQTLMLAILVATCAILAFGSFGHIDPEQFSPVLAKGWGGVLAATPLMISLFLGIESAVEVGGEIKNAERVIPVGIAVSVVLTAIIYLAVAVACLGVLGAPALSVSKAPLLDLADSLFGASGVPFILLTATVAIGTSINATFMIYARFLYAMGRTGVLPKALGRVHPRFRTPHFALTAAFATCCLGLFLPSGLIFLFLAVNIPTLLKYAANALAALRLLEREPALYERAAFKPPRRALIVICYASVIAAIAIIGVGLSADWRPYVLLGGWAVIGAVYYALRGRSAATARLPD